MLRSSSEMNKSEDEFEEEEGHRKKAFERRDSLGRLRRFRF